MAIGSPVILNRSGVTSKCLTLEDPQVYWPSTWAVEGQVKTRSLETITLGVYVKRKTWPWRVPGQSYSIPLRPRRGPHPLVSCLGCGRLNRPSLGFPRRRLNHTLSKEGDLDRSLPKGPPSFVKWYRPPLVPNPRPPSRLPLNP